MLFTTAAAALFGNVAGEVGKKLLLDIPLSETYDKIKAKILNRIAEDKRFYNHDLEKAVLRSFVQAVDRIINDLKRIIQPSELNGEDYESVIQSFNHVLDILADEDKNIEKLQFELPSARTIVFDEITELLSSNSKHSIEIQEEFIKKAYSYAIDYDGYKTRIKKYLWSYMKAYFAVEIKYTGEVYNIFTAQLMVDLKVKLEEIEQTLSELSDIKRILQENHQLLKESLEKNDELILKTDELLLKTDELLLIAKELKDSLNDLNNNSQASGERIASSSVKNYRFVIDIENKFLHSRDELFFTFEDIQRDIRKKEEIAIEISFDYESSLQESFEESKSKLKLVMTQDANQGNANQTRVIYETYKRGLQKVEEYRKQLSAMFLLMFKNESVMMILNSAEKYIACANSLIELVVQGNGDGNKMTGYNSPDLRSSFYFHLSDNECSMLSQEQKETIHLRHANYVIELPQAILIYKAIPSYLRMLASDHEHKPESKAHKEWNDLTTWHFS